MYARQTSLHACREHLIPFDYITENGRVRFSRSKFEKSLIVSQIIEEVRNQEPQGDFVRSEKGKWFKVNDQVAREKKVGQK